MKKFLPAFFLMACLVAAFAQTKDYTKKDANGNALWSYNDGVFTFNSTYVWTDFAARIDDKAHNASGTPFTMADFLEFGYYKIENGQAGEAMTMFQRDASTGEMVVKNSVIFNGGDKIGIYAKLTANACGHYEVTVHGKTYTGPREQIKVGNKHYTGTWVPAASTDGAITWTTTPNAIEGASTNVNNVDRDSIHDETQYFCLFLNEFTIKDHFEYYPKQIITGDNYDDFINDVIAQNTDEHGNPISNITDSPCPDCS